MEVGLSDTILKGTHPGTIYAKFGSIWPSCFRGEDFFNISQSENRIILGGHVYRPNGTKWRNFIRGPYIDAYCQVWFHLAKLFQRRRLNQRLSRACIVHLVIKKNNWSYVKTMSCSGSHLGITINIKNTKFVKDLPMIDA